MYGAAGGDWADSLPWLVAECQERWVFTVSRAFEPLSYNYVAGGTRKDGTPVVLKLGFPCPELKSEIEALLLYAGVGAVRLLDHDSDRGALLLEALDPGECLANLQNDEAAAITRDVMQRLHRSAPVDGRFPSLEDLTGGLQRLRARFGGGAGPFPADILERAEALALELLASSPEPVLLHGDLHHWNILSAEREPWLAIDPKGILGDPAYEPAAFVRNRLPADNPAEVIAGRLEIFAAYLDRERVRGWGVVHAVLSAWWTLEDGGVPDAGWHATVACAEILSRV